MDIRKMQEQWEAAYLSPFASLSVNTKGRQRPEEECDVRTCFQRDRDRIIHCKSFRRMKDKTQVFLSPEGDHYRTRLTHTLEVSQISRTCAKALMLNENLTEAIALGHDLGHTPFGHAGEAELNKLCSKGFDHSRQSLRTVERIEKKGVGLNLTFEVRDGILNHQTKGNPSTLEGKIVRLCDKIAYINHDIDDAIRARILKEEDIPKKYTDLLGNRVRDRLNTMIHDLITSSMGYPEISMSEPVFQAMMGLRAFMFENVYRNPGAKTEEKKARKLLAALFEYYIENPIELSEEYRKLAETEGTETAVCDYIAGMTDRYAVMKFQELFQPRFWKV
ncbi:MAG: deoxyguanosinetriphosphate triphosphohydrolase [Lachnospiraceae bacterium]|nr:deoxyguanosinetriphosphate triphosphohydrolase [Lachnospiraceae bacterium]